MRQLILTAFISTDGVMEAPGGGEHRSAGWTFNGIKFNEAAYAIKGLEQAEAAALLVGRQAATTLNLVEHDTYPNGIQMKIYDVVQ